MNCTCPKCKNEVEFDQSQITEDESRVTCPGCNTRFLLYREQFACRALRKSNEIFCAKCGKGISHSLYCHSCGTLYPDYYVAALHRKRVREKIKISGTFSSAPEKRSFSHLKRVSADSDKDVKRSAKSLRIVLAVGLIVVLIGAGLGYYYFNKVGKQYSSNLIMALYGVKSGTDMSLKICTKLADEWKSRVDAGSSFDPRISPQDEASLNKVKIEIDIAMQKLVDPPNNFVKPTEKLNNLYNTYNKIYQLALVPQPPLSKFTESVSKLESSFNSGALEFKGSLSKGMLAELRKSSIKYKNLQFLN